MQNLCLEFRTEHDIKLRLFWAKESPLLHSDYLCGATEEAAVGNNFNIFSYDALSGRDSNLKPSRQRADALRITPPQSLVHPKS